MSGPLQNTDGRSPESGRVSSVSEAAQNNDECSAEQLKQQLDHKQKEYEKKLSDLENDHQDMVEQLKTEVRSLQTDISDRKKDQGRLEGEIRSLRQAETKRNNELEQIKAKLQKREKELEETKVKLKADKEKAVSKLEKELARIKENNSSLQQDIKKLVKQAKEDVSQINKWNNLYLDYMKVKNEKMEENEQLSKEKENIENRLAKEQFELRRLQQENTKLNKQLSKEWSTKVASSDSDLENISIKTRPLNIKGEYEQLAIQEWLEAKTQLDEFKDVEEGERIQLLCSVLEIAEKIACETHKEMMTNVARYLRQPLCYIFTAIPKDTADHKPSTSDEESSGLQSKDTTKTPTSASEDSAYVLEEELSPEFNNMIRDYVRYKADEVDVRMLQMEINRHLKAQDTTTWLKDFQQNPQFQSYIKACSRLTWKMMLQKPQMRFSTDGIGQPLAEKTQDPHYLSENPKDPKSVVMMYVTPTLYHTEYMMVKGRVCTKILK